MDQDETKDPLQGEADADPKTKAAREGPEMGRRL